MKEMPTGGGGRPAVAPSVAAVERARCNIRSVCPVTPLLRWHGGSAQPDILLKLEVLQPGGSFKLRGVYNWALQQDPAKREKGLTTFSAGNTAIALGYVARLLGVPARSYLPGTTPGKRIALVQSWGVETVLVPMTELMERMFHAHDGSEHCILHPWHDPDMIAGSATIGWEILHQTRDLAMVYIPVGGGGLAAGVAGIIKRIKPSVKIIGVEPEATPALYQSLAAGKPVWIKPEPTLCESVAVPLITDEMFPLLRLVVDEVQLVGEATVRDTIKELVFSQKVVVEGAGALALAAALADQVTAGKTRVCILSGGNIEPERLAEIIGP